MQLSKYTTWWVEHLKPCLFKPLANEDSRLKAARSLLVWLDSTHPSPMVNLSDFQVSGSVPLFPNLLILKSSIDCFFLPQYSLFGDRRPFWWISRCARRDGSSSCPFIWPTAPHLSITGSQPHLLRSLWFSSATHWMVDSVLPISSYLRCRSCSYTNQMSRNVNEECLSIPFLSW